MMAVGEARRLKQVAGRHSVIVDGSGTPRKKDEFQGLDYIRPGDIAIRNGGRHRPYVAGKTDIRWKFREFRPWPGEIRLTDAQRALGRPVVLIEPNLKAGASPAKRWTGYQDVVDLRPELPWAQFDYGMPILRGVERIKTASFAEACGVLSGAIAAVLPEGGLHHAAAALGIRAVVIFGGYISPASTGYAEHINLWINEPEAVGWRIPSTEAKRCMDRITPTHVANALDLLLL